jgi:hypothetical protein
METTTAGTDKPTILYSPGALAELFGLPVYIVRRALDTAARRGMIRAVARTTHSWRMVPDHDVPAIAQALRFLGHDVKDPPPPGTPLRDEAGATLEKAPGRLPGRRPRAAGNGSHK